LHSGLSAVNTRQAKGQFWLSEEQEIETYKAKLKEGFRGDARSKIIYHVKQYDKVMLKFSCKTKSPAVAYRAAPAEVKKRLEKPEDKAKRVHSLISDEIEKYEAIRNKDLEAGEIEASTFAVIRRALKPINDYFGPQFPEIFEADDWPDTWDKFCEDWRSKNPGETMFNVVKYATAFTRHLHNRGVIRVRPQIFDRHFKKEKLRLKKKRQRIYTTDEAKDILNNPPSLRDRIIGRLGYENAFRIDDCCTLEESQINLDQDDPYVQFQGEDKAGTFIKAPLSKKLRSQISEWIDTLKRDGIESQYLFPQLRNPKQPIKPAQVEFTKVIRAAGVNYGTHHILRHTRLTLDFGNPNIPQLMVCLLRRVSLRTAQEHYIHPTKSDRMRMIEQLGESL